MAFINNKESLIKRRLLRRNQTPEESILWEYLRKNKTGLKWRRQIGMGFYIADFYCHSKKIIIELDGNHHYQEKNIEYDKIRDRIIKTKGIFIARIKNQEIRDAVTLSTIVERVVREADRVRMYLGGGEVQTF